MGFIGDFFSSLFGGGEAAPIRYDNIAARENIMLNAEMQQRLAEQSKEHEMQLFAQRANMAAMQEENERYLATLEEKTQQDLEALLSGIAEGVTEEDEAQITSFDFTNFFDAMAAPGATPGSPEQAPSSPQVAEGTGATRPASPNVRPY